MTIAACHEDRIVLQTDWEGYERLLGMVQDGHVRITYDRGTVELMSPSLTHERLKSLLRKILESCLHHARVDYVGGGETTLRKRLKERGLEPDECYWIEHWEAARVMSWDPDRDPPPDLALEIEVTESVLDRLAIYADLGVPEVWRYTADHEWSVGLLHEGAYRWQDCSPTVRALTGARVVGFVRLGMEESDTRLVLAVEDWLGERGVVLPDTW